MTTRPDTSDHHANGVRDDADDSRANNQDETDFAAPRPMKRKLQEDDDDCNEDQEAQEDEGDCQQKEKKNAHDHDLSRQQVERYSRQMLLTNGFGVTGQQKLLSSSVLVVGAGGIGSSVLLYLAGAGIGRLGIVDYDTVEMSNLHRQVIHAAQNVGESKAESARRAVLNLNPTIACQALATFLNHDNALDIISQYDVVVDASDNPKTRYIVNDACVLSGKPLVSASAVGTEGQLTVYNWKNGPCYRCMYPKPATIATSAATCSDAGVLGPVPGLVGILQSMEVIKILTNVGATMHDRMLLYDSLQCSFLTVKKPQKQPKCPVCGTVPTIKSMEDSRIDLVDARGPATCELGSSCNCTTNNSSSSSNKLASSLQKSKALLPPESIVSCQEYKQLVEKGTPHVLLDVRVSQQFEMWHLDGAVNIPLAKLQQDEKEQLAEIERLSDGIKPVFCICRRGIASTDASDILLRAQKRNTHPKIHSVKNIVGGLEAWHVEVDSNFPKY